MKVKVKRRPGLSVKHRKGPVSGDGNDLRKSDILARRAPRKKFNSMKLRAQCYREITYNLMF